MLLSTSLFLCVYRDWILRVNGRCKVFALMPRVLLVVCSCLTNRLYKCDTPEAACLGGQQAVLQHGLPSVGSAGSFGTRNQSEARGDDDYIVVGTIEGSCAVGYRNDTVKCSGCARGAGNIRSRRCSIGHPQGIISDVVLLVTRREYSQSLLFYWSSVGNILSRCCSIGPGACAATTSTSTTSAASAPRVG